MNRTKNAIIDAFWQLLEEKPYNKITVKDIVDSCEINRNTFYYHFRDIPDLLENIVKHDADYLIQTYGKLGDPIDCLTPFVEYILKRKKAILHIYRSVQREVFLEQAERITLYAVSQYIDTVTSGSALSAEDQSLLIRFYKCTLIGIVLDWLDAGMDYDLLQYLTRINQILKGWETRIFFP